jgi:hypothetical protein
MTSESLVGLPCSSGDEEVEEEIIENTQDTVSKKRGKGKEYHFFASFETLKLAEDSLKEERLWSKAGMRKKLATTGAYQQFYRCCRVKYREKQCCTGCVIISPADKTSVEVHKTICAHDHIEKVLSVSIEARLEIDKMYKVVRTIRPKTILSNLEAINRSYEKENAKIREDPKRQHEKEKALIVIPLFADLYNFLARYRKKELINGKENFHLGSHL